AGVHAARGDVVDTVGLTGEVATDEAEVAAALGAEIGTIAGLVVLGDTVAAARQSAAGHVERAVGVAAQGAPALDRVHAGAAAEIGPVALFARVRDAIAAAAIRGAAARALGAVAYAVAACL